MPEKKVLIEITEAVYDANGKVSGVVSMDYSEAVRLVDLKVARLVDTSQTTLLSERVLENLENEKSVKVPEVSEKPKDTNDKEPVINWKKDDIRKYLNEKKISFDTKDTKEVLIGIYSDWKKVERIETNIDKAKYSKSGRV